MALKGRYMYYIDRHIAIKTHYPAASEPLFSAEQSQTKQPTVKIKASETKHS